MNEWRRITTTTATHKNIYGSAKLHFIMRKMAWQELHSNFLSFRCSLSLLFNVLFVHVVFWRWKDIEEIWKQSFSQPFCIRKDEWIDFLDQQQRSQVCGCQGLHLEGNRTLQCVMFVVDHCLVWLWSDGLRVINKVCCLTIWSRCICWER